jgi:hypothetical protein
MHPLALVSHITFWLFLLVLAAFFFKLHSRQN